MQKEIIHLINLKIYLNMQKKKVLILQFMLEKMANDYFKQALKFCNKIVIDLLDIMILMF